MKRLFDLALALVESVEWRRGVALSKFLQQTGNRFGGFF